MNYAQVGKITHYFDKIQVGVLAITEGEVKVGDTIRIGEEGIGFEQAVESMQVDHNQVESISAGQEAGLKLTQATTPGTVVYKVSE